MEEINQEVKDQEVKDQEVKKKFRSKNATGETKRKAKEFWIVGMTNKKIAKDIGVSHKTIESWAKKYNWIEEKKQIDKDCEKILVARLQDRILKASELYFNLAEEIATKATEEITNPDKLYLASKAALNGAKLMQLVCPDFFKIIENAQRGEMDKLIDKYNLSFLES
jgi:DNA-binding XRE family transcriptional regulator